MLKFDPEKCTGCLSCHLACSDYLFKTFNPEKAVLEVIDNGLDAPGLKFCRHCEDPPCYEACSFEAMRVVDGVVIIDQEKCEDCGLCEEACPYNAIFIIDDKTVKCTLCDGKSECVNICASGALRLEE